VIEFANSSMVDFLKLFGIEDGNGLFPFCRSISTPAELKSLISEFLKPPQKDTRGCMPVAAGQGDVGDDSEDEDEESNDIDEDDGSNNALEDRSLSPANIADHVSFINECPIDLSDDCDEESLVDISMHGGVDSGNSQDTAEMPDRSLVDPVTTNGVNDATRCFTEFIDLLNCRDLGQVPTVALQLTELLELGKIASGSIASQSKYMSLNQRWFKAKEGGHNGGDNNEEGSDNAIAAQETFVMRNSLVKLSCVRGKKTNTSEEYYRVLSFFTKIYNKWYMDAEGKFVYTPANAAKMKNVRILAQLMEKKGASHSEATLTKGGQWGLTHVFCIKNLNDIKMVSQLYWSCTALKG